MKEILTYLGLLLIASNSFAQVILVDTVTYTLPTDNIMHEFKDSIYNNTPNTIPITWNKSSDNLVPGVMGAGIAYDSAAFVYDTTSHLFFMPFGSIAGLYIFLKADTNAVIGTSYVTLTTQFYGSMVFKINTVPAAAPPSCDAGFIMYEDTLAAPHTYIGINTCVGNQLTYDWSWGDGTPNDSGPFPSHTYATAGIYNICVSISDTTGCTDNYCSNETINKTLAPWYTVTFGSPSAVSDLQKNYAIVYPNPTHEELFVRGENNLQYRVDIYTMNSSKVFSTFTAGNQPIHIGQLANGLYFAKISHANGNHQYFKFLKQ
jgi:PKD repeat protein